MSIVVLDNLAINFQDVDIGPSSEEEGLYISNKRILCLHQSAQAENPD